MAGQLLAAADAADAAADQYAALVRARDLAIAAADAETLLEASDELGRWFELDSWQLKSKGLAAAVAASTRQTAAPIGEAALKLAGEAAEQKPGVAAALVQTANAAALKAQDRELKTRARALSDELTGTKSKPAQSKPVKSTKPPRSERRARTR